MRQLTRYIAAQFLRDALILFMVVSVLLFLVQCLRVFDIVAVQGHSLAVLGWQGLLSMPPLVLTFAFVCIGIGVARALVAMRTSHELHIIHTGRGLKNLLAAAGIVALVGAVLVTLISTWVAPTALRQLHGLNAALTADLVSSTLRPGQFSQATPGVVLHIGGRTSDGEILDFFADDRRDPMVRRTYIAEAATVLTANDTFVLALRDGVIASLEPDGNYSEVGFGEYQVNVERFSQSSERIDPIPPMPTPELMARALSPDGTEYQQRSLVMRFGEGLKVLAMVLVVVALGAFPSGRRSGPRIPLELSVLVIAFLELAISAYGVTGPVWGPIGGSLFLVAVGSAILAWRVRPRRAGPRLAPAGATP